jgi:dedicator of cytokinesis protein 3
VVKVAGDGTEETWLEKTYFTTEESFPTVLRRSEIVAVEVVEISPVEHALQEVEQRTKELATLYSKYSMLFKTGQIGSVNALTMALNAAVDSPIDSGVPSFRYFLTNEYIVRNADKAPSINKLRIAIDEQVCLLI